MNGKLIEIERKKANSEALVIKGVIKVPATLLNRIRAQEGFIRLFF